LHWLTTVAFLRGRRRCILIDLHEPRRKIVVFDSASIHPRKSEAQSRPAFDLRGG
jgi:hypothetical protein